MWDADFVQEEPEDFAFPLTLKPKVKGASPAVRGSPAPGQVDGGSETPTLANGTGASVN